MNRVSMPPGTSWPPSSTTSAPTTPCGWSSSAGAGEKAFTAGGDIAGFMARTPEELSHLAKNIGAAERCPKPVVAELHGFTFGVGLELALACDLRVAADDTVLGLPEITLGMIPGSGGTQRLAHLVGLSRAKDAILRGRRIAAGEALAMGAGGRGGAARRPRDPRPGDRPRAGGQGAAGPARWPSGCSTWPTTRPSTSAWSWRAWPTACCGRTDDFAEGVAAFAERRPPKYTGS